MNHPDIHYMILLKCDIDTIEKMNHIHYLSHQLCQTKHFWYEKLKQDQLNLPRHHANNDFEWIATYKLQNLLTYINTIKLPNISILTEKRKSVESFFTFKYVNDCKFYKPINCKSMNDYYQLLFNSPLPNINNIIYPPVEMIKIYSIYICFYFDEYIDPHWFRFNLPEETSGLYQLFLTNLKEINSKDLNLYI